MCLQALSSTDCFMCKPERDAIHASDNSRATYEHPHSSRFLVPACCVFNKPLDLMIVLCTSAGGNLFGSYPLRSKAQQSQATVADVELNAWKLPKLAWATLFALCAFLLNASHVFQVLGIEQRAYLLASAFIYRQRKGLRKWSLYGSASIDGVSP